MNKFQTVFIIAGEASGDLHGAHLVKDLSETKSDLHFFAMGSQQLADVGAKLIIDSKDLAVVGFLEVLANLKKIRHAFKSIIKAIQTHQPNMVILIDYPGFNLRLAKAIKRINRNIKVVYYISPQIWAWRYKRIFVLKKCVDLMAVIFPFEVPIYKKVAVPVKFVGHPLIGQVKTQLPEISRRQFFGLSPNSIVIGLMPGSRRSEIKYILPTILESAELMARKIPNVEFVLPLAPSLNKREVETYLHNDININIITNHHYDALSCCNAVIVASGTATLELAILAIPMVVIYKTSRISFALAKKLVKVKHVSLCNIVADKTIVKELLQEEANPQNIASEITRIVQDHTYCNAMIQNLKQVKEILDQQQDAENLSNIVLTMLIAN